jgi:hypothetical protein
MRGVAVSTKSPRRRYGFSPLCFQPLTQFVFAAQVNMSLKLYKSDDRNYLLDFQSLPSQKDGEQHEVHTIEFFELCAMLITELGR